MLIQEQTSLAKIWHFLKFYCTMQVRFLSKYYIVVKTRTFVQKYMNFFIKNYVYLQVDTNYAIINKEILKTHCLFKCCTYYW